MEASPSRVTLVPWSTMMSSPASAWGGVPSLTKIQKVVVFQLPEESLALSITWYSPGMSNTKDVSMPSRMVSLPSYAKCHVTFAMAMSSATPGAFRSTVTLESVVMLSISGSVGGVTSTRSMRGNRSSRQIFVPKRV